jgi:GT2 family glycosyltransferase
MNRPDDLDRCLNSVFSGAEYPNEVIVSDDSPDPAKNQAIVSKYPQVVYQSGPRRGLSPNRNACIDRASSSHLIFIDDDVRVSPGFIATARKLIAISASQTILTGYEMNHRQPQQGHGRKVIPQNPDFWGVQRIPVAGEYRAIVINATVFPRCLFETARFDEHLRYGCDEIDMARHAVSLGYRIVYHNDLYVHHYPSPLNREQYKRFIHASRFYTTTKAYWQYEHSWLKALTYLIFAPLQLAASGLKRGDLSTVWKAIQATGIAYHYLFTESTSKKLNSI